MTGPNDDPEDEDIAMDPDEDLPWPNFEAAEAWWSKNQGAFEPHQRHLLGRRINTA